MNSSQTFQAQAAKGFRFAAATAAVVGLVFAAAAAQAMPAKSPQDHVTTPAYGAAPSTGSAFKVPTVGLETAHITTNPAVGAQAVENAYQSDIPVLGFERDLYSASHTKRSLTFVQDGDSQHPASTTR